MTEKPLDCLSGRSPTVPEQPERTIPPGRFVRSQSQTGKGEDLRCFRNPAVIGIAGHVEKLFQSLVVEWQLPAVGKLGQLVAEAVQAGAVQGSSG